MTRPSKDSPVWVSTLSLATALGVSDDHLHNLRNDGTLKPGKHWRNIARRQAIRPTYRWHLKNCENALAELQELR